MPKLQHFTKIVQYDLKNYLFPALINFVFNLPETQAEWGFFYLVVYMLICEMLVGFYATSCLRDLLTKRKAIKTWAWEHKPPRPYLKTAFFVLSKKSPQGPLKSSHPQQRQASMCFWICFLYESRFRFLTWVNCRETNISGKIRPLLQLSDCVRAQLVKKLPTTRLISVTLLSDEKGP